MIAEILDSKSFKNVCNYHSDKIDDKKAKILSPSMENYTRVEMMDYLNSPTISRSQKFSPLKKEPIFHVSLSISKEDRLTDEQFLNIANDYIKAMGFKNNNYIVIKHEDTDNEHVHVILNRIELERLRIIENGFERLSSMKISRRLEKKYHIKQLDNTYYNKKDKEQQELKEGVIKSLKNNLEQQIQNSYSYQNLKMNLLKKGIYLYEKEGKDGKIRVGYRYDYFGKSKFFNSTDFKNGYSYLKLQKQFYSNNKGKIINTLNGILANKTPINNTSEFTILLKREGINVIYSKHPDNSIFGIRFEINSEQFKGSELGFDWNKIKDKFLNQYYKEPSKSICYDQNKILYFVSREIYPNKKNKPEIPFITQHDFETLTNKYKKLYISNYIRNAGHLCMGQMMDGLSKFSNMSIIYRNGLANDISCSGFNLSNIGYNYDSLLDIMNIRTKRVISFYSKFNNVETTKDKLKTLFEGHIKFDKNQCIIDGIAYNIGKDNKEEISGYSESSQIKPIIFPASSRFDKDHWHFDDIAERDKRKKKKKRYINN